MTIPQTDQKQIDIMAQAGELLATYTKRHPTPSQQDGIAVLASAVLAVAGELRDIHNVLHEINQKLPAIATTGVLP